MTEIIISFELHHKNIKQNLILGSVGPVIDSPNNTRRFSPRIFRGVATNPIDI